MKAGRIMKRVTVLLAGTLFSGAVAVSAAPYDGEGGLPQRYVDASLVAKVRIAGVHRVVDQALSEPGMTAVLGYVYSGVAEKVWRGPAGKLIAFRLELSACQSKLQEGEAYLIFAHTDADGLLELTDCSDAIAESQADSLLVQLNGEQKG